MSNKLATLIAVTNLKGGVGKSTISSILASKFNAKEDKKTCVFNIAKGQSAETINEVETIDYSSLLSIDRTISASEALASIMENYDYIFVDTAGDLSEELIEIISYIDYFIVPFDKGKKVFEDTITYLKSIFTSGIIEDKEEHNICLIFNKYNNKADVDEVKDKYINELNLIALENSIKFNIGFSKLSNSDVVETMEDKKASIDTLSATNAVAYRIFNKKIDDLYLDVKTHLESVIGEK